MAQKHPIGALFKSTDELASPVDAFVTGTIPDWLRGSLLRVGPGKFDLGEDFVFNHLCDGLAIIFKFEIKDGRVQFHKRFLRSDAYQKAMSVGHPVYMEYATRAYSDTQKNVFSRMVSSLVPDMTDNCFQNLYTLGGSIYAVSETSYIREIDPETLETGKKVDLSKAFGAHLITSHMREDNEGNYYYIGTSITTGIKYNVVKIPATSSKNSEEVVKRAEIIAKIPTRWKTSAAQHHSFGLTEKWIVFIEQPLVVNCVKLVTAHLKGKTMKDCSEWCPQECNLFYIVNKLTGKILPIKYKSEKIFFMLHHINSYEDDGHLIIDIIGQDSPESLDKLLINNLRNSEYILTHKASMKRFVLPLAENIEVFPENENLVKLKNTSATATRNGDTITVSYDSLTEPGYEFPTVNRAFYGKSYKYFYASGLYDESSYRSCALKVNLETREVSAWKESEYSFPGQIEFVASPDGADEDDGVLLTVVSDVRDDRPDFLLILDAKTMTEIARAEVREHVPNGIHGLYLPV